MFMECLWGYRLPARRCDKSLRASYRYVKRACTIHDSSYYWCIEVRGSPESVLSLIGSHVSPKPLRHVSELAKHEHSGIFADSNATSLGPVRVIFSSQDDGALQAWVWAHPSSAAKILDVLTANPAGSSVRKINVMRIELNGALSHDYLRHALHPDTALCTSDQLRAWASLTTFVTPSSAPAGAILGLSVHDPRLFPMKRNITPNTKPTQAQMNESAKV